MHDQNDSETRETQVEEVQLEESPVEEVEVSEVEVQEEEVQLEESLVEEVEVLEVEVLEVEVSEEEVQLEESPAEGVEVSEEEVQLEESLVEEVEVQLEESLVEEVEVSEVEVQEEEVQLEESPVEEVEAEAEAEAQGSAALLPWLNHYDKEIPYSLEYPAINIAQFLINAAENYPSKTAVEFLGNKLSYEKLYLKADHLAKYLVSIGINKGDRVAIMLPNSPQAVIAYYGILLAGAVVVQTNPLYVERELKLQLADSGAVALIAVDLLINRIKNVRGDRLQEEKLSQLKTVIITSIADGLSFPKNVLYKASQRKKIPALPDASYGYVSWSAIYKKNIVSERPILEYGDELAAIQYTGGTTGTPKGVMLSHKNLVANTLQLSAWCYKGTVGEERYLAALPLFHVFGLTVLMNYSVSQAGQLILLPRFDVEQVLKTIVKKKPTIFPGAPTMYIAVLQAIAKAKRKPDLSSINICISGAAALPLEVQEQFEAYTGGRLVEGFGQSEASPVTHANPIWGKRKIGTVGIPLPNTEAAIIDPVSGTFLGANEIGELIIKGPQVMLGYWNRRLETEKSFIDGWLRTGDMAKMDEDGFFTIVDRIKDIIIASGFNIYPREIEEVLYEHPAIAEATVIGVKDEYRGETVKAYIVPKENVAITEAELDTYCRSKLAAYKVPQYYEFRDSLPKTIVGKILKRELYEKV